MRLNIEQRSQEWHDLRKTHIGGTDISAIIGSNPHKTAYQVWEEKTGRAKEQPINFAMQHGIDTEPVALEALRNKIGVDLKPAIFISDDWNVAMASLDGISNDNSVAVEIKCPISDKLVSAVTFDNIPKYYIDQVQWQLYCTGLKSVIFSVYYKGKVNDMVMFRNEKRIKQLAEVGKHFWQENVLSDIAPQLGDDDEAIITDPELCVEAREIVELKLQIADLESQLKPKEDLLKSKLIGKSCYYPEQGLKIYKSIRPGLVDNKKIYEDYKIDDIKLNSYRKAATEAVYFKVCS